MSSSEPSDIEQDFDMDDDSAGEDQIREESNTTKGARHEKGNRKEKRLKKKFDFERNSRTIFVGNLPKTIDQKGVSKLFKPCGPVEAARIRNVVPEKEKLPPKVALIANRMHPKVDSFNAYVVFEKNENDECVKKALAMNGRLVEGHHIRVDRAQRPRAKKQTLASRKKSVFVGNLRFDVRDEDLFRHFNEVGPVNHVRIVRDRATGLGKGFGFVVFDDRATVKKALELNDKKFKGRELRVKKVDKDSTDTDGKSEKVKSKPKNKGTIEKEEPKTAIKRDRTERKPRHKKLKTKVKS